MTDENRYHPNGPWEAAARGYFTRPGEKPWAVSVSQGPRIVATVTGSDEATALRHANDLCRVVNAGRALV